MRCCPLGGRVPRGTAPKYSSKRFAALAWAATTNPHLVFRRLFRIVVDGRRSVGARCTRGMSLQLEIRPKTDRKI